MALGRNVVVLLGGVGGAKLAVGLARIVPPRRLTFVVNTGDDFWHLGLKICPDVDTLMYTLAGLVDPEQGWGVKDDTAVTLDSLAKHYGHEAWFRLGDKDLATHLLRTHLLREGHSLTAVTGCLARRLGIEAPLLPMCDAEVPTTIDTVDCGELGFQEYFVKHGWQPTVRSIGHRGCEQARLSGSVRSALQAADAVIIAPSNPWLSLAPILSIPGMRALLAGLEAPVVAVTPIIAGAAVKGPTAKIMAELGLDVTASNVVDFYSGIIDGFVDDVRNAPFRTDGLRMAQMDTLMKTLDDKIELARATLDWTGEWA